MSDEWYYAEDGETVGPLAAGDVIERLTKSEGPHFVWSPGLPDWTDARALPQFSTRKGHEPQERAAPTPAPATAQARHSGLAARARHEFLSYLAVSGYLMVWFSAVMVYKATILRSVGVEFAPIGIAVAKALILGKFIITLEAVKLGERRPSNDILAVQILKKALLFTAALFVMTVIEELVVGRFHGRSAHETLAEMAGGSLGQAGAMALLMFLVLLPYLAFRRLALELGELPEVLFMRRPRK